MTARARRLASAAIGAVGALLLAAATPGLASAETTSRPLNYVALGDSYAAAPLVPDPDLSRIGCLRSRSNYPHQAAAQLGARLTDMSCSGATIDALTAPQGAAQGPQLDALGAETDVVSISIGGNDAGLVNAATVCKNDAAKSTEPCTPQEPDGAHALAAAITAVGPRFAGALAQIDARAPHAAIYVLGYGDYVRDGGCPGVQPFAPQDATDLQHAVNRLDAILQSQADQHGAHYLNTFSPGQGHDSCADGPDRWIEGFDLARENSGRAAPLHPTAEGSQAFGDQLAAAIQNGG
jgi:lysophospholipase L1-like esterase